MLIFVCGKTLSRQ